MTGHDLTDDLSVTFLMTNRMLELRDWLPRYLIDWDFGNYVLLIPQLSTNPDSLIASPTNELVVSRLHIADTTQDIDCHHMSRLEAGVMKNKFLSLP